MHLPWNNIGVCVVGDVMLDEYLNGDVHRISPEAPVPVHLVKNQYCVLGGAANSAANIQALGGVAHLFSLVGCDTAATSIQTLLQEKGIVNNLIQKMDRTTTQKTRIVANNHQICRVDRECTRPLSPEDAYGLESWIEAKCEKFKAILISDYGKGILTPELIRSIFKIAADWRIPVVVDPKNKDFTRYVGATLITPNRKEACDALKLDPSSNLSGEDLGKKLRDVYGFKNVLVTLGSEGMTLVTSSSVTHLPTFAQDVYDVSGAGDTVAAVMTLGLAAGISIEDAMRLANTAAGVAVSKAGTHAVTIQELLDAMPKKKFLSRMRQFFWND